MRATCPDHHTLLDMIAFISWHSSSLCSFLRPLVISPFSSLHFLSTTFSTHIFHKAERLTYWTHFIMSIPTWNFSVSVVRSYRTNWTGTRTIVLRMQAVGNQPPHRKNTRYDKSPISLKSKCLFRKFLHSHGFWSLAYSLSRQTPTTMITATTQHLTTPMK